MTISRNLSELADNLNTNGTFTNVTYTGLLTGGTGVVNIGSGQIYKDASGNVGIGTATPGSLLTIQPPAYTSGSTKTVFASLAWTAQALSAESYDCNIDGTAITAKVGEIYASGVIKASGILGYSIPGGPDRVNRAAVWGRSFDTNYLAGAFNGNVEIINGNLDVAGTTSGIRYTNVGVPGGGAFSNAVAIGWTGTQIQFRVDSTVLPAGTLSDRRVKTNISPATGILDKVLQLNPVFYRYSATQSQDIAPVVLNSPNHLGFIAQEVETVIPEAVTLADPADSDSLRGLDAIPLISALAAAIKEQQQMITQLQADVAALKAAQ
jgi:hypothetical protein